MSHSLGELAERLGGEVVGDAGRQVAAVRSLEDAGPDDLSPYVRAQYREQARASAAGALLVAPGLEMPGKDLLRVKDPAFALVDLLTLFHPPRRQPPGVHPTAVLEEGCQVDAAASVGAHAVIGAGSRVAAGVVIHPGVVLGRDCLVAADAEIHPNAVLYDGTEVGERSIVHAGAVLGADGFGYATRRGVHHKVPQVGRVVLEADVEVGANSAIDRATFGETRIGAGTKIDNLVQVGHNVRVGKGCILCGQVGIAGSARLGDYVVMGGQSGSAGHLEIGEGVQAAARTAVLTSVAAGTVVAGTPAVEIKQWRRQLRAVARLGKLSERLKAVEKALAGLGAGSSAGAFGPLEEDGGE